MPGGVFFNENDFFTCSSGLFPAQFASTSQTQNNSNDVRFLTVQDKVCRKQDFSCKWIVVLAAAIVALCVTGVGAMLVAALVGACIGLGLAMTLCGSMASMARNWLQPKTDVFISSKMGVTMRDGPLMTCSLFGATISAAPNIKHQWQAVLIGSVGTVMAGLEGFMYATAFRGAGTLLKSPAIFFENVGGNYLATLTKWGVAGRTVFGGYGAVQQHYVKGENDAGNLTETFSRGFFFEFDMADRWMHGNAHIQDIALIFSMGGIPAPPRGGNKSGNPLARAVSDADGNSSGGIDRAYEDGNAVVRRAQGGQGTNAGWHRIIVDKNGNVEINGSNKLYITIDDANHAVYFYNKRGGSASGAEIVEFEIPKELAEEIKANAVRQADAKKFPNNPEISDPSKSKSAYGLPKEWIDKIQEQAIPGSGKVTKP